jgi:hypothetical protein
MSPRTFLMVRQRQRDLIISLTTSSSLRNAKSWQSSEARDRPWASSLWNRINKSNNHCTTLILSTSVARKPRIYPVHTDRTCAQSTRRTTNKTSPALQTGNTRVQIQSYEMQSFIGSWKQSYDNKTKEFLFNGTRDQYPSKWDQESVIIVRCSLDAQNLCEKINPIGASWRFVYTIDQVELYLDRWDL